jgi:hypothetical protein
MFSWVGRLFGTQKAIDDFTDKDTGHLAKFGEWVGNFSYTDEEKAEANLETKQWALAYMKSLEPFKVMQRIMVTIIMAEWAILFNAIIIAIICGSDKMVASMMAFAQSQFAWVPICGAVSLYLLGGVWPSRKTKE